MDHATLRRLSFTCLAALPLLLVAWYGWWAPPRALPLALVLAVALAPLALALAACAFELRFGLLLGGIFALFYFSHGVMEAWASPGERLPAALLAVLSAAQIVLLGAAASAEKRARREAAAGG
jgi:uncharacterized membrane protein